MFKYLRRCRPDDYGTTAIVKLFKAVKDIHSGNVMGFVDAFADAFFL
jgi:hypothetical protein